MAEFSMDMSFSALHIRTAPKKYVGGYACAVEQTITISHEALALAEPKLSHIFAHEIAHIAQKRIAAPPAKVLEIEAEAENVAKMILLGQRTQCHLSDDPMRPAFYEELGHYYTCYYIMLLAGVDPMGARIRAFFAQLPDEVLQFDATSATRDYHDYGNKDWRITPNSLLVGVGGIAGSIPRATPESEIQYSVSSSAFVDRPPKNPKPGLGLRRVYTETEISMAVRHQRDQAAIHGLHCLTGMGSADETKFRTKTIQENWTDPVISGLALHPFGDSFSHREIGNEWSMYDSHHGHLFDMHQPDYIAARPELYLKYAEALYETISKLTSGSRPSFNHWAKPMLDRVIQAGCGYKGALAEEKCLAEMKGILRRRDGFDESYAPEKHIGMYWDSFANTHKSLLNCEEIGGERKARAKIEIAGRTWRERRAKVG